MSLPTPNQPEAIEAERLDRNGTPFCFGGELAAVQVHGQMLSGVIQLRIEEEGRFVSEGARISFPFFVVRLGCFHTFARNWELGTAGAVAGTAGGEQIAPFVNEPVIRRFWPIMRDVHGPGQGSFAPGAFIVIELVQFISDRIMKP